MTKRNLPLSEIDFRPAKPSDAKVVSGLLFETFPKKAAYIIGLGSEDRAKKILKDVFPIPGHRLSYECTTNVILSNKVIGAMVAFPGSELGSLNRSLYLPILNQYKFSGKLKLISRAMPLFFLKETMRDEFFLSNLGVRNKYRNQGIGGRMLLYVEGLAKEAGYSKISLIVNLENQNAMRFYDRYGYKVKALNLISNKYVAQLGPGSQRRVKELCP